MYVYMFICMCVCMYVCMYVCIYVGMYVYMYVCLYVCMYVCVYIRMYVCMYVCPLCIYVQHICTYVYMCSTYVCMNICMMYVRMYMSPVSVGRSQYPLYKYILSATTSRPTWDHACGLQNCNICGTLVTSNEYIFVGSLCSNSVVCGYKNKIDPFKLKPSLKKFSTLIKIIIGCLHRKMPQLKL